MYIGLLFAIAIIAILFAILMWNDWVRPVPQVSATGLITNKTFVAARTIQRLQGGPRRESWTEEKFKIPDSYVFEIRIEGLVTPVQYSMVALGAEKYNVGEKVLVRYVERGIGPLWKRIQVTEIALLDASPAP